MQKIILFIEPTEDAFETPFKIGHLFMNRFTIEEEANFEIVKIFEFGKSSWDISNEDGKQKGMSLSTLMLFTGDTALDCINWSLVEPNYEFVPFEFNIWLSVRPH